MSVQISPGSHTPIYQQIINGLRDAIAAGVYRGGEMLPSIRELAVQIRVNPNTVQRAYEALERDGIIYVRRGLGMFVTNKASRTARACVEEQMRSALDDAVARALSAGMRAEKVREIFDESLAKRTDLSELKA